MKKLLNKSIGLGLAIFLFVSLLLVGISKIDFSLLAAKAEYSRDYSELTDEELDRLSFRSEISNDTPQITVFTHGFGSTPSHWTSDDNYNFAYEEASMVEQLCRKLDGEDGEESHAVVFKAKVEYLGTDPWDEKTYSLEEATSKFVSDTNPMYPDVENNAGAASLRNNYNNVAKAEDYDTAEEREDLTDRRFLRLWYCNPKNGYNCGQEDQRDKLTAADVSRHIIVIFESAYSSMSNDFVYGELEYILDVLSYQYCQLTEKLPTYNLIGHSRGGMTNLQYALGHPYNVASLYSMGTPYNGSAFGGAAIGDSHPFLSLVGYTRSHTYTDAKDYVPGILDILNSELNESYKSYWNDHYSEYSHIAFKPIGSYVTLGFILQALVEFIPNDKLETLVRGFALWGETEWGIYNRRNMKLFLRRRVAILIDIIKDIVKEILGTPDNPWIQILDNVRTQEIPYPHLGVSYDLNFSYADDIFIDLNSQVAEGYTGRQVKVRLMDSIDQMAGKKNVDQPGVAHNLETHNPYIVDYVVNDLSAGQGKAQPYDIRYVEGGCIITNLKFNENEDQSVLTIPETYKGQTVVGIDKLTRDIEVGGTKNYHSEIEKVIIPKTVKKISDYAFYGMNNLKTVSIDSGSILESIGEGAFMNCKSLASITLPKGVNKIGTGAFAGCSSLTSFLIGANVSQIGANAFFNCDKLTAINVATGNTNYSSQDGVLFDYNKTQLLQYPYGKAGSSYTVPASVSEIGEWAFFGNKTLTTINLNQVNFVRKYAFCECTNLASITGSKVKFAEEDIAFGTSWLNNANGDMVVLGKALLEYRGSAKSVNLQGIASIAPFAFSENTTLEKITIDNELINIGQNAFYQCENLKDIYLNNTSQMVFIGTNSFGSSNEERTIYVPHNLYTEYRDNEFWKQYADEITVHQTKILFNSNGGNNCEAVSVEYLDYIGELPVPQKDGYVFLGWYDNTDLEGNRIEEGLLWESLEDTITLYAKYRQKSTVVYSINYHPNGGTVADDATHKYTSDDEVILSEATKKNYIFKGWYYDEALKISAGNGWGIGETGNKDLYAKWEGIQVKVTVNQKDTVYIEYGSRGYLPKYSGNVEKGYEYIGWAESKSPTVRLTDEKGRLLSAWNRAEDTNLTLVPMFNPITYTITFILQDGVEEPGNPDTYTIETATFTLKSPTRNGYIFDGWYENGKEISSIPKGSTGNKTIESHWKKLYTISFYANGGRACNSITGTYGETIRLPYSYRTGCTGKWSDGYAFGASYTIVGDKTFSAIWKSNQYKIYFTIFGKVVRTGTYTYFDDGTAILWDQPYSYVPEAPSSWYTFDGWYKKSTFTSRVTEVTKGETGDKTVYGRWRYRRSETFTITDDGVFKQSSDWINLKEITGYTLSELKAQGYKNITFNGELTVWQKNDGYKYMQIYDGTGSNAKRIHEWWIDHRDGKTKKVWQLNNDGSLTINLDALTNDTLCFRYTASGNFADTWYNSDCMITVKSLNK